MDVGTLCSKCKGIEKCTEYCLLHVGENLVNFINGVDVIETEIGELRKEARSEKYAYIVSGHMIEKTGSPTYMLSDLSTSIDITGKFSKFNGVSPQQILKAYLEKMGASESLKKNSLETFKKFNSNKLLPVPIKPGSEIDVDESLTGTKKTEQTVVSGVKWSTDRTTGKLSCDILCRIERSLLDGPGKTIRIPITEYGGTIHVPLVERTLKSAEIDPELIKMTPVGFIKPIVVTDGKNTLAVDGCHMYKVMDGKAFIIGTWKGETIVENYEMGSLKKTKVYMKINNAIKFIDKHKRYIIPYGLHDANVVEIK